MMPRIAVAGFGLALLSLSLAWPAAPAAASAINLAGRSDQQAGTPRALTTEPVHYAYTRVCSYGPRGWLLRNHRGQLIACHPYRPNDFGWSWRDEGGRAGWYHSRDRIWR